MSGRRASKETVNILEEINMQIPYYLLITLVSNILIGVCIRSRSNRWKKRGVWGRLLSASLVPRAKGIFDQSFKPIGELIGRMQIMESTEIFSADENPCVRERTYDDKYSG